MTSTDSHSGGAFDEPNDATLSSVEPVAPLQVSANRWVASSAGRAARVRAAIDRAPPCVVDRKVRALLNKLTTKNFDSISDQIVAWANKSEKERGGRTLIQVTRLVLERAKVEVAWNSMHARLCRKMMEQISKDVRDEGIKNSEGNPIAGGQPFRKFLLSRCQEEFEKGWATHETITVAGGTDKTDQEEGTAANGKKGVTDKSALYWDEDYAAQKVRRRRLGLIKFIGELFKLHIITERIIHECTKKLLGSKNSEEEKIENLCQLLTTAGRTMDTPKAKAHIDAYFQRMKEFVKAEQLSPRAKFTLLVSEVDCSSR